MPKTKEPDSVTVNQFIGQLRTFFENDGLKAPTIAKTAQMTKASVYAILQGKRVTRHTFGKMLKVYPRLGDIRGIMKYCEWLDTRGPRVHKAATTTPGVRVEAVPPAPPKPPVKPEKHRSPKLERLEDVASMIHKHIPKESAWALIHDLEVCVASGTKLSDLVAVLRVLG